MGAGGKIEDEYSILFGEGNNNCPIIGHCAALNVVLEFVEEKEL